MNTNRVALSACTGIGLARGTIASQAACPVCEDPEETIDPAEIDALVEALGRDRTALIPLLLAIQKRWHYLPPEALRRLSEATGLRPAEVTGVATFYGRFRLKPAGRHRIRVCVGTACHIKGADSVHAAFCDHLGLAPGEDTDRLRLFTIERVACLGCCMLAPAVQIDDVVFGPVEPSGVAKVLGDFLSSREAPLTDSSAGEEGLSAIPSGEVRLCLCASCAAAGAREVEAEFRRQVRALGLPLAVKAVGCTGFSYEAPLVDVFLGNGQTIRYGRVRPADARSILLRHGRPVSTARRLSATAERLLECLLTDDRPVPVQRFSADTRGDSGRGDDVTQVRLATAQGGRLSPLDLDEYMQHDGFDALRRCLRELSPAKIIALVESSGLRGRGGAGYPTGRKWAAVAAATEKTRYVIGNGDEGDPGAFMDRMLLESFPFRIVEGMAIAARAVGAAQGILYIRDEYPLAIQRIQAAITQCDEAGLLGEKIMGTGFSFRIQVVAGAGAFVCGEETALIAALEGRRGHPSFRPPYPSERGLHGCPTLVNNVETLALVPWVVRHGEGCLDRLGTATSRGTKTFALAGKVARSGLIEVPMGISLREIVERLGGGVPGRRRLKAVQVGGPSGGCVPESLADTPVDYEALTAAGAIMGSGGLVVMDETDCMVDIARYFMAFTQAESCGQCTPCRSGTRRMLDILERLCRGEAGPGDLGELERLAGQVRRTSLCGLGRSAPNPVLSTMKYFRDEYEAHLAGFCPAGKCRALFDFSIDERCIGCTRCARHCPTGAIAARPYLRHRIEAGLCARCGVCREVCPAGAVVACRRPAPRPLETRLSPETSSGRPGSCLHTAEPIPEAPCLS